MNHIKVRLLLQSFLSHTEDDLDSFLVLRDALHLLELLVELVKLAAELLGIIIEIHRGVGDTLIASLEGQRIFGFEFNNLVIRVVVGVVKVLDRVDWVLSAHQLRTLV